MYPKSYVNLTATCFDIFKLFKRLLLRDGLNFFQGMIGRGPFQNTSH